YELARRCDELLGAHRDEWFGAVARLAEHHVIRRGFAEYIDVSARRFAERADEIFAAAPVLQEVWLNQLGRNMPAVVRRPELGRLRRLAFFESTLGSARLVGVCRSPHLGRLRQLSVIDGRVRTEGAAALAEAESLTALEELELDDNPIYDQGARAILQAPRFAQLRRLQLSNGGLSDHTALALK